MRIVTALAVAAALLVSACATTANYERTLNSWLGHKEEELVASWGPPQNVYVTPSGARILTYTDAGTVYLPGTPPSYRSTVIGNTVYSRPYGGTSPMALDYSCTTHMTVEHGVITHWRYEGNNCVQ